jgi:quercetin dioxygenase-like cupin family protein
MPIFSPEEIPMADVVDGVQGRRIIDQPRGSGAITLGELTIQPGKQLPRHRHRVEEAIVIVAGRGRFELDGVTSEFGVGSMLLAPAGSVHSLECMGDETLRIYFAFPAVNVDREWM